MVETCVDYALHQLNEIEAFQRQLECSVDHELYEKVHIICKKASLGDLKWYYDSSETISRIGEYWEQEAYPKIQSYQRELMFLKMIFCCFANLDDTDANLRSMVTTLEGIWEDLSERIDDNILSKTEHGEQDWDLMASFLEGTIQQCKLLMVDYCYALLGSSLQCKPLPSDQAFRFFYFVLDNLVVLGQHKAYAIPLDEKQRDIFIERLSLSRNFLQLMAANERIDCKELRNLMLCFRNFANEVAFLVFLFWAKATNEDLTLEAKTHHDILSDMRRKIIKPFGSNVTALYLNALKAIKSQSSDDLFLYQYVVEGLVDLHLHDLVAASKGDLHDLKFVQEGLIFLLTFVYSPPEGCNQDEQFASMSNQIDVVFSKCTYLILSPHVIKNDHFTLDMMLLNDFASKMKEITENVKQLYVKVPDSSSYSFPRTNGQGFHYFLLQNLGRLNEKLARDPSFIPFAQNWIVKVEEELVSLSPLVNGIFELQKQRMEFEETWSQLINLTYRIEHVIDLCSVCIRPIWYNVASLSVIVDQIQDMKRKLENVDVMGKLEEVGNSKMHYTNVLRSQVQSSIAPPQRTHFSLTSQEEVIGLKEETSKITDELIRGYESLGIISIIGMGGLGKTTLAKAVCSSKKVRHHFHKVSWGSVSQVLKKRNFFVEILCGIKNCRKDEFRDMTEDDLAHHLWRCLSGQTYLIILDDVWDIKSWDAIKSSFPDDKNKSRVIFTTREAKVALDAKSSCHYLRLLSDDESLKLLHMTVFGKDVDCPRYFYELGKVIARNCKGLPLSIVVIAGILASNRTNSSWWKEIAEATCQFIGQECKQVIEYSYKHLPEHLKSCFLYMGIYEEDELIVATQLRELWIGEGFVNKSTTKCLRITAKEYLRDLVDRNLVITVSSTHRGDIKTCRLHDLIGDFCRRQAEEDNFLWLRQGSAAFESSNSTIRNLYRVSAQRSIDDVEPMIVENIRSLILLRKWSLSKLVVEKLKLVQVLHLEWHTCESIFLYNLVHLRYLSIITRHRTIPEAVCNLWNLETFIVEKSGGTLKLPKTIWKMKMLRHLHCFYGCEFDLDDENYEESQQLLDNLEFLSCLELPDNTTARAVLQRVPNIQKLVCSLQGSGWRGEVFEIDFLRNLETMYVWSLTGDLHITFPVSLKRLHFCSKESCSEDILYAIGQLPYLEALKLMGRFERWEVKDGQFTKLKSLQLAVEYLKEWNVSFDSFYCLEQLSIRDCFSLEQIPACFAECPTLQKVETISCSDQLIHSAIQIVQELKDNGNEVEHFNL